MKGWRAKKGWTKSWLEPEVLNRPTLPLKRSDFGLFLGLEEVKVLDLKLILDLYTVGLWQSGKG